MALVIRLQPTGRKQIKTYRIVVQEARSKLQGDVTDQLGYYQSQTNPVTISIDRDKTQAWIEKGATPSETVAMLLAKENFIYTKGFKLTKPVKAVPSRKVKAKAEAEKEAVAKAKEEEAKAKEEAAKAAEEAKVAAEAAANTPVEESVTPAEETTTEETKPAE